MFDLWHPWKYGLHSWISVFKKYCWTWVSRNICCAKCIWHCILPADVRIHSWYETTEQPITSVMLWHSEIYRQYWCNPWICWSMYENRIQEIRWYHPPPYKQGKSEGFESCDWPIVRKRPIWVKMGDVLSRVTFKFDGWPWKTKGHLSFAVSSFVQHFIAIGEFKLEWQSGNAQFGSNSTIFRAVWPWNLTDDLENNRASLLCYFKLYASFRSHRWIQAGVTVRKRPIWVKINDFFSRVTLQVDVWPWKTIGHLFYSTSSFVHHFVAIGDFKLELQSRNAQFGSNSTIFRAVWPWNLTDDLEKQ